MSTVRDLYDLQLVDSEHQDKSKRLGRVNEAMKGTNETDLAWEAVAEIQQGLSSLVGQMRTLELEIGTVRAKLKSNQDYLYSGKVKNPKELSNLQEEASALRRRTAELEDQQLELMIDMEEQEAELAERRARHTQIKSGWEQTEASLKAEQSLLLAQLAELERDCTSRRSQLSKADLAEYDSLREHLGGRGVALLKNGICQACGVNVHIGFARAVQRGEGFNYCPTCTRLLSA